MAIFDFIFPYQYLEYEVNIGVRNDNLSFEEGGYACHHMNLGP